VSAGAPCWVEALEPDPRAAAEFYGSLLGWECALEPIARGESYYVASVDGQDAASIAQLPPGAHPHWMTFIRVDDVDAAWNRAVEAGGTLIAAPLGTAAGRLIVVEDPCGATFGLWQAREREGVRRVDGSGAWAMSALRTSDLAGAARFYGALFGWTAEASKARGGNVLLFHLPGHISRRSQQFPADVVAYAIEIAKTEHSAWSVAFWASDIEVAARLVVERGGRILVGPMDSGGIQRLVITDPFGAMCTLTARPS
jgi:uncharacterized protein